MDAWGIEGETPQEGEWPKRDGVPRVEWVGPEPLRVRMKVTRTPFATQERLQSDGGDDDIVADDSFSDRELKLVQQRNSAQLGQWIAQSAVESLRAELMGARDALAKFTAAKVPNPPKPAHDFTRDFSGDRRMMGPTCS